MGHLSGNALDVRVVWASRHTWAAGQDYNGPCYAHALWLVLEGQVEVSNGEQRWQVPAGHAFLWPRDMPRRVLARREASWLSLGVEVTTPGQTDILRLLPLPAQRQLPDSDGAFLRSWLQDIIGIRDVLARSTPPHIEAPKYLGLPSSPLGSPEYDQWVNQVVASRASHFDAVEEGLARAIVAWCWGLWSNSDLEHALYHESPPWLQRTLSRVRENPSISVEKLARDSGFSLSQFRRAFHQSMGLAPRDYLQRQRLDIARHLLENTEMPISAIASRVGFSSVPHFVQLWKRSSGLSPLQYRIARRQTDV